MARDLILFLYRQGWRRADERSDGSYFDPDDLDAQLAPPETWAMMAFRPGIDLEMDPDDDDGQGVLLLPAAEPFYANDKESQFKLWLGDWLGREPGPEDYTNVRRELFTAYRPPVGDEGTTGGEDEEERWS
jgi:hypothetical protein